MIEYRYIIKSFAQRKIRSFYYNVSKKYRHTYSKWYFAYTIDGDTITIVDACHAQNMK